MKTRARIREYTFCRASKELQPVIREAFNSLDSGGVTGIDFKTFELAYIAGMSEQHFENVQEALKALKSYKALPEGQQNLLLKIVTVLGSVNA